MVEVLLTATALLVVEVAVLVAAEVVVPALELLEEELELASVFPVVVIAFAPVGALDSAEATVASLTPSMRLYPLAVVVLVASTAEVEEDRDS